MYSKELEQMLHSDDFSDRVTAAECAYGLDILVNDESPYVREEVARQGYGLDRLINDEDANVRKAAEEMLVKQKEKQNAI